MSEFVVVSNTFRRPLNLVEKALRSFLNQKVLPQKIILIDQNQPPLNLSSDLKTHPLIEIQQSQACSVSGARNGVVLPENCKWVCFCDDDGYWAEDFSENLTTILQSGQWDVIAGSVLREDTMEFYSLRHKFGGNMQAFRNLKLLMGSNFCVNRKVFEGVGRFDTRFGAGAYWGSSEETDFAWKCYFYKARISYKPELKVIHVPPFNESLKIGFQKSYKYAVGKGALVGKWLWEEKRALALMELTEMLLIPLIQIVRALLTLKLSLAINNLGVLAGRIFGFLRYLCKVKK